MKSKEVASMVGLDASTLRKWELDGLIPPVERTVVGFRNYSPEDVEHIQKLIELRLNRFKRKES